MNKSKSLGQVYTPKWVVNEILDLVDYNSSFILNKKILEPACGDGAFLIEIVTRYIVISKEENLSLGQIIDGIENNIYGIELDEEEYNKCIVNLNEVVHNILGKQNINWKIFNCNTLFEFRKYKNFFDYVVGNPPYIRIHNLDVAIRQYIKENFLYSVGTIDIYLTFFEMANFMIKDHGKIGYITPNSYLHNTSYFGFRDFLKANRCVKTLIDFKENKVFKGFSTYTAITILEFNSDRDSFTYKEYVNNTIREMNEIRFKGLSPNDWSFTDRSNELFLKNMHVGCNTFIKELFDVQYGFATLRDKIYVGRISAVSENSELAYFNNFYIEKDILMNCIKGSTFKGILDENYKIIFPYKKVGKRYVVISEEEMKLRFPHCYCYFSAFKEELQARDLDKGALWYEYGRSQGIQSMQSEKIILSSLVYDKVNFFRVPENYLMYSGIYITRKNQSVDWKLIENLLRSDEFYQFVRIVGKDFSGGYKSITTKLIKDYQIFTPKPLNLFNYVRN